MVSGGWEPDGEWFWLFESFSKLKITFSNSIEYQLKSKLAWLAYTEYEVKIKIAQEQWLQLKMKFLLGNNMKIVI